MSWVANLFNPSQAQQLAPSHSGEPPIFSSAQNYEDDSTGQLRPGWRKEHAEPMDEEEEAARAPYWHVRRDPLQQHNYAATTETDRTCSV